MDIFISFVPLRLFRTVGAFVERASLHTGLRTSLQPSLKVLMSLAELYPTYSWPLVVSTETETMAESRYL